MQIWLKLISEMLLLLLIVFIIFAKYCGPLIRYVVTSNISFPESVGVIVDASNFDEARRKLKEWYLYVSVSNLPEFNYCFETISRWHDSILNSFKVPYTNAYTEGVNNKVKVLKRNAFGLRNYNRLRSRILFMMSC